MTTAALILLAAVNSIGLCGLLVWVYNRTFSGLHESLLKKSIALLSLPAGLAGGLVLAFTSATPAGPWLCAVAGVLALATMRSVLHQRRAERLDAAISDVEPAQLATGAGIAWRDLGPIETAVLSLAAPVNRPTALVVKTYRLEVRDLPAGTPIRVVYVSDFHIHRTLSDEYYREVVRVASSLQPDVVLLGGDYVTREGHIGRIGGILHGLRAECGVFAIRGNHDFWTRPAEIAGELRRAGISLLSQEAATVQVRGCGLRIAGIESPYLPLTPPQARRIRAARPHIVLVHSPDEFPTAARLGAQVAIAGHTHGGQVRLPFFGTTLSATRLGPGYALGACHLGATRTIVSSGAGSFVPLRVNCPPEVLLLLVSGRG